MAGLPRHARRSRPAGAIGRVGGSARDPARVVRAGEHRVRALVVVADDGRRGQARADEDAERPPPRRTRHAAAVQARSLLPRVHAGDVGREAVRRPFEDELARGGGLDVEVAGAGLEHRVVDDSDRQQPRRHRRDQPGAGAIVGDHLRQRRPPAADEPAEQRRADRHREQIEEAAEQRGGEDVGSLVAGDRQRAEQDRVDDERDEEGGPHGRAPQAPAKPCRPHALSHPEAGEDRGSRRRGPPIELGRCTARRRVRRPRPRRETQGRGRRSRRAPEPQREHETRMAMSTTRPEGAQDPSAVSEHLTLDDRIALLRYMLLMRGIEERAMNLYRQGKVPGSFYDGYGQEAVSVGATFAMSAQDRLCILHRDLGAHLIRGVTPARILGQYMGREGGITGGRDGNVHFGDFRLGCVGMVSMLPDMMLVATGMAMAFKLRHERRCAITWFGDGSTSRGDFHEAVNWAGVQKLPIIFVLENNQYAYSTPTGAQFAVDPVERAQAYGFPGISVDGNDAEAMFEATRQARERALDGGGPTLLEAVTMRMHGHAAHDDMKYVPKEQVEEWRAKDPIDRQVARAVELGIDVDALRAEVKAEIDAATERALQSPMPDPATATDQLFYDGAEDLLLGDGQAPYSGFAR